MKRMTTITVAHTTVRPKDRRKMVVLGCVVEIGKNASTITGDSVIADEVAVQFPQWLKDGLPEGCPVETSKKVKTHQ